MSNNSYKLVLVLILSLSLTANSQEVKNFESSGIYLKHKGELLIENNALLLSTFIDLEPYHNAIELVRSASLSYKTKCLQIDLNCEKEFYEIKNSYGDLTRRMNNIYHLLLERPIQRRKRFLSIIGIGFGIANTIKANNLARDIENLRNYMQDNFHDIKNILTRQSEFQYELKKQVHQLNGTLNIHEKKIEEIFSRIEKLKEVTSSLQQEINKIRMNVIFHELKLDVLEILGKIRELEQWIIDLTKNSLNPEIMTPQNITDSMQKHPLKNGKYLAPANLNNYEYIKETISGVAFIVRDLKTIFITLKIPIYQENTLNLFDVIQIPVFRNKRTFRLTNIRESICALSEDLDQFYCTSENHKFVKGKTAYFVNEISDVSLLPTVTTSKCIINIITEKSINYCRYKEVTKNLEIINEIHTHKFLFAVRDKTKYLYECQSETDVNKISSNNFDKNEYLQGTGILYLKPRCSFRTDTEEHAFETSGKKKYAWKEKDIFEFNDIQNDINEKLKYINSTKKIDFSISSLNFEDLRTLP